jgi:hypothetical protein
MDPKEIILKQFLVNISSEFMLDIVNVGGNAQFNT